VSFIGRNHDYNNHHVYNMLHPCVRAWSLFSLANALLTRVVDGQLSGLGKKVISFWVGKWIFPGSRLAEVSLFHMVVAIVRKFKLRADFV
jgi:hypothetical protein